MPLSFEGWKVVMEKYFEASAPLKPHLELLLLKTFDSVYSKGIAQKEGSNFLSTMAFIGLYGTGWSSLSPHRSKTN